MKHILFLLSLTLIFSSCKKNSAKPVSPSQPLVIQSPTVVDTTNKTKFNFVITLCVAQTTVGVDYKNDSTNVRLYHNAELIPYYSTYNNGNLYSMLSVDVNNAPVSVWMADGDSLVLEFDRFEYSFDQLTGWNPYHHGKLSLSTKQYPMFDSRQIWNQSLTQWDTIPSTEIDLGIAKDNASSNLDFHWYLGPKYRLVYIYNK